MAYITVAGGPEFSFIWKLEFRIKVVYQILNSLIIIHFTYPVSIFQVSFLLICLFLPFVHLPVHLPVILVSLLLSSLFFSCPATSFCSIFLTASLSLHLPLSSRSSSPSLQSSTRPHRPFIYSSFPPRVALFSPTSHLSNPAIFTPTSTFLFPADPVVLGRALWLRRCRWRSLTLATTSWSV